MRVTVLLGLVLGTSSAAAAQVPAGAPPTPASYVAADVFGEWVSTEGVAGPAFALAGSGAWAPHPALELGGGLDVRGTHLASNGDRGAGRFGLGTLRAWVGTGAESGDVAGGARLVGDLGSRAVGLDQLDGGAAEWATTLQLDGTWQAAPWLGLATVVEAGLVHDGVTSGTAAAELDVAFLEADAQPFVGFALAWSSGIPVAPRLRAGVVVDLAPWALAAEATAGLGDDPAGHVLGLTVTVLRALDSPR